MKRDFEAFKYFSSIGPPRLLKFTVKLNMKCDVTRPHSQSLTGVCPKHFSATLLLQKGSSFVEQTDPSFTSLESSSNPFLQHYIGDTPFCRGLPDEKVAHSELSTKHLKKYCTLMVPRCPESWDFLKSNQSQAIYSLGWLCQSLT